MSWQEKIKSGHCLLVYGVAGGLFARQGALLLAQRLVKDHGIPLSEVARHVGVSTSAVSKMIGSEINLFNEIKNVPQIHYMIPGIWIFYL